MAEQQFKKANELHEDIEKLSRILNRDTLYVGGYNGNNNAVISHVLNERCEPLLRKFLTKRLQELEEEFEAL